MSLKTTKERPISRVSVKLFVGGKYAFREHLRPGEPVVPVEVVQLSKSAFSQGRVLVRYLDGAHKGLDRLVRRKCLVAEWGDDLDAFLLAEKRREEEKKLKHRLRKEAHARYDKWINLAAIIFILLSRRNHVLQNQTELREFRIGPEVVEFQVRRGDKYTFEVMSQDSRHVYSFRDDKIVQHSIIYPDGSKVVYLYFYTETEWIRRGSLYVPKQRTPVEYLETVRGPLPFVEPGE